MPAGATRVVTVAGFNNAASGGLFSYEINFAGTAPATVAPVASIAATTLTAGSGSVTPTIVTPAQGAGSTLFSCSIPLTAPSNFTITTNASQTLTAAAPLPIGMTCVPQAAVTTATLTCTQTATPGPNPANAAATITCPMGAASADLSIALTDSPDPVIAGQQLTYVATLTNAGPSDAQGANISFPLPVGTTLVSATASAGGSCNAVSPVVCTWAGATAPAVARTATIVVTVAANVAQGTVLNPTATAASTTTDPTPANNTASTTTTVNASADLSITLTDSPDPVLAGQQLTYVATLTNAGPSDAQGANISLPLPFGTSFVSATPSTGGSCNAASPVVCTWAGGTPPGTPRTATIVALVAANVADGTVLSATATASSTTTDPSPGNNAATTTTSVIARADLQFGLISSEPQVLINVPVTFTATSLNAGPSDAQNLSITVTLTPDFRFSSHVATGATCTTPQIGTTGAIVCTWAGATPPATTRTLTVVAYSNVEGSTGVSGSTTSATTDPIPNNNATGITVVVGYPFTEIPTLSQWGLLLLGLLLAGVGFVAVRRQN